MNKTINLCFKRLIALFLTISLSCSLMAQAPERSEDVMLQAFGWDTFQHSSWFNLNSMAAEIGANFDLVWLPPSGNDMMGHMGYHPVHWFDQNSAFGTQQQLITLIQNLRSRGTRVVADIVINHRNGVSTWYDFPVETYQGRTHALGTWAITSGDEVWARFPNLQPRGGPDTGTNWPGARDLDLNDTRVQAAIHDYLHFLRHVVGYDGWRYDIVKGFSGSFIPIFNNQAGAHFSVGEYWDGSFDAVTNWIRATNYASTAFDFPQKYAINEAFNNGYNLTRLVWTFQGANQPAGLVHHPTYRRYAVTFLDNHDTGRSDAGHGHSRFTGNVLAAYAFILSGPGIPNVWMNHWIQPQYRSAINALIAARKRVGIHSQSTVVVNHSRSDLYVATVTGNTGTLIVKIGPGAYIAPGDFELQTSGTNYAVWTRGGTAVAPPPPSALETPVTVRFQNSRGWTGVNIHYWTAAGPVTTLPGVATTHEGNNWFSYTLPANTTGFLFLNPTGAIQTADISAPTTATCYGIGTLTNTQGHFITFAAKCPAPAGTPPPPGTPITVRFRNTGAWSSVNIYAWTTGQPDLLGRWPGIATTAETDNWHSYTFDPTITTVNVVFTNGTGTLQTADITNITASTCYEFGGHQLPASVVPCPVITNLPNPDAAIRSFRFFPNPVTGYLLISNDAVEGMLSIVSVNGTRLVEMNIPAFTSKSIDLTQLSAGIYFVKFLDANGKITSNKLVKH